MIFRNQASFGYVPVELLLTRIDERRGAWTTWIVAWGIIDALRQIWDMIPADDPLQMDKPSWNVPTFIIDQTSGERLGTIVTRQIQQDLINNVSSLQPNTQPILLSSNVTNLGAFIKQEYSEIPISMYGILAVIHRFPRDIISYPWQDRWADRFDSSRKHYVSAAGHSLCIYVRTDISDVKLWDVASSIVGALADPVRTNRWQITYSDFWNDAPIRLGRLWGMMKWWRGGPGDEPYRSQDDFDLLDNPSPTENIAVA